MRKVFMTLSLLAFAKMSGAQISEGGLPLRLVSDEAQRLTQPVTPVYYKAPDLQTFLSEDKELSLRDPAPYRCGKRIPVDISFPGSGTLITLSDGRRIWRAQIDAGKVPGLLFYYDRFSLPQGVKYFLTNANNRQILGAYTEANNAREGLFATQEVQGGVVNFELDIDKGVVLEAIQWHINEAAVMFRAVDYLAQYAEDYVLTADWLQGSSSVCQINAICPQGSNYPNQRKATARIISPLDNSYVGLCTGTLVNNTSADCQPYFLTASHCESSNSTANSTFAQCIFYFNFETPDCAGTGNAPNTQTVTGATFVSRSSFNASSSSLIGDFMLLRLNQSVPSAYGAYLAGWNRATTLPASNTTYIGFHHPAGDIKKLSKGTSISGSGTFNQFTTPNTHWRLNFTEGGIEGGSSGSGLFDVNGRLVGDLSGAPNIQACPQGVNGKGQPKSMNATSIVYSKFSRNWQYPEGNGAANRQLKPWLDPNNTGAITTNALAASSCQQGKNDGVTGIGQEQHTLEQSITLYPNPVVNGTLRIKVNLPRAAELNVTVYDITGSAKASYRIGNAGNGDYALDMKGYANGTYLVKIGSDKATISRKIMVQH
ncbi:T9SS type A sorting domain-containing protein [Taibaiella helva]|uniref:T9SS type A sorting domain-containing protein n=1 Tax=Taibaiella helva TaxID=2301235 RepID=UPI000E58C652|nr:T9SS type A sorting domain-containing protein [Taibaiella helva]